MLVQDTLPVNNFLCPAFEDIMFLERSFSGGSDFVQISEEPSNTVPTFTFTYTALLFRENILKNLHSSSVFEPITLPIMDPSSSEPALASSLGSDTDDLIEIPESFDDEENHLDTVTNFL
jgi:hypothetical protein